LIIEPVTERAGVIDVMLPKLRRINVVPKLINALAIRRIRQRKDDAAAFAAVVIDAMSPAMCGD